MASPERLLLLLLRLLPLLPLLLQKNRDHKGVVTTPALKLVASPPDGGSLPVPAWSWTDLHATCS
jgi:hypothetical protein